MKILYFILSFFYFTILPICAKPSKQVIPHFKPSSKIAVQASIANLIENAGDNYKDENYESAILNYKKAFEKDPVNPLIHFGLGACYIAEQRYELAIEHFSRALELNPALLEAYFGLSYSYIAIGKKTEALIVYRQGLGLDLNKNMPRSTSFNQVTLFEENPISKNTESNNIQNNNSIQNDDKIISFQDNPFNSSSNENNISSLNIKEDKPIFDPNAIVSDENYYIEQINEYEKELIKNPNDNQLLYRLGSLYIKAKQIDKAQQIYQNLINLDSEMGLKLKEAIEKYSNSSK